MNIPRVNADAYMCAVIGNKRKFFPVVFGRCIAYDTNNFVISVLYKNVTMCICVFHAFQYSIALVFLQQSFYVFIRVAFGVRM